VGVASRSVPGLYELLDGGVSVWRLREVEIADLLRRAPVPLRPDAGLYLQDQVVLISGAGGSIGSELCRQVARTHWRGFSVCASATSSAAAARSLPIFTKQIHHGGPITITHPEMTRFVMTIPEAVYLVLKAGGLAVGGELFVLNMGAPVPIVDLARDLIRLSGLRGDEIPIVYTGLRPGEKLDEALWEPGAICEPVGDDDVLRVTEPGEALAGAALQARVSELLGAADRGDATMIRALLRDLVPSYEPTTRAEPAAAASAPASLGSAL
jgi:FlaA1/EpsC-like NDP-sugar epimerase